MKAFQVHRPVRANSRAPCGERRRSAWQQKAIQRPSLVCTASKAETPGRLVAADKKKLGDSDLLVSICCLGTMTWGSQNTEAEAHQQMSYAVDQGINFWDAAEVYPVPMKADWAGRTEQYIGTWLKEHKREEIIMATKVAGRSATATYLRSEKIETRVVKKQVKEAIEKSLQRLQTDYVDLYQIHWPDRYISLFGGGTYNTASERDDDIPFEEQLEAFQELLTEGKIRHLGVSNETSFGIMRFTEASQLKGLPKIVSIQNAYSLLVRSAFETDLAETCAPRNCNVGLLAYSPLAGGVLTGKYIEGRYSPKSRLVDWQSVFGEGFMDRYNKGAAREATEKYLAIAKKYGFSLTQLALAWCKSRWFVTSSIIGATSVEQLKEDLEAFNAELPEECIKEINAVHMLHKDPAARS